MNQLVKKITACFFPIVCQTTYGYTLYLPGQCDCRKTDCSGEAHVQATPNKLAGRDDYKWLAYQLAELLLNEE